MKLSHNDFEDELDNEDPDREEFEDDYDDEDLDDEDLYESDDRPMGDSD